MKKTYLLVALLLPSSLLLSGCFDKESHSSPTAPDASTAIKRVDGDNSENHVVLKDKNRTLLEVAGLDQIHDSASKIIASNLEPMLVDFTQGSVTNSVSAISQYQQVLQQQKAETTPLNQADNLAGLTSKPNQTLIFRVRNSDVVILPIEGKGYLSYLKGYLALHLVTGQLEKVRFYQQGETPALGGHIMTDMNWLKQFEGKVVVVDGQPSLQIIQPNTAQPNVLDLHTIDGISGATNTSQRVEHIINYWLGDNGYGPILKQLEVAQS